MRWGGNGGEAEREVVGGELLAALLLQRENRGVRVVVLFIDEYWHRTALRTNAEFDFSYIPYTRIHVSLQSLRCMLWLIEPHSSRSLVFAICVDKTGLLQICKYWYRMPYCTGTPLQLANREEQNINQGNN